MTIQPLVNHLLLLYTVNKFDRGIKITRLQKIMFLSQWNGNEKGYQNAGFTFIRYKYGPFSRGIDPVITNLAATGLVRKAIIRKGWNDRLDSQTNMTFPLEEAATLIKRCKPIIKKNRSAFGTFDKIISYLGSLPLKKLLHSIYAMEVGQRPIRAIEFDTPLLADLEPEQIKVPFYLTEEWIQTLEVLFDPETQQGLNESLLALREGDVVETDKYYESL